MSLAKRVYHIDRGPTDLYPVDAAHAVGAHPHEWSHVPWTDEMRDAARPHLEERAKRQAEAQRQGVDNSLIDGRRVAGAQVKPGGQTGDPTVNAEMAKRLQGDVDAAQADLDRASSDLDAVKAKGDDKATTKAQAAVDQAKARRDDAQAKLDAAKQ